LHEICRHATSAARPDLPIRARRPNFRTLAKGAHRLSDVDNRRIEILRREEAAGRIAALIRRLRQTDSVFDAPCLRGVVAYEGFEPKADALGALYGVGDGERSHAIIFMQHFFPC